MHPFWLQNQYVATVLTVYGIETASKQELQEGNLVPVATVLTVYGIETCLGIFKVFNNRSLQQYLPFTVLKPIKHAAIGNITPLQQYLPFTVLKQSYFNTLSTIFSVATVLTVYGIET